MSRPSEGLNQRVCSRCMGSGVGRKFRRSQQADRGWLTSFSSLRLAFARGRAVVKSFHHEGHEGVREGFMKKATAFLVGSASGSTIES